MGLLARRHAVIRPLLAAALLLMAAPLAALETVDGVRTLRSADVQQTDYPTVQAVHFMSQNLHRQSGGKLAIQVYSSALLGDEAALLQLTQSGDLDLNRVSAQALEDLFPLIRVLSLPFLFRDVEHVSRVLDGPIGAELLEAMNGKGLVALAFFEAGGRSISTVSHPVRRLEDLKGLRIRVQPSTLAFAVFEAWGARPIKLPFSQTGNALATHLIDAAENNLLAYASAEHHRHAPRLTLTHHTFSPEVLVMSRRSWDALSGAEQAMLRRAARDARPMMRDMWQQREERVEALLRLAGVSFVELPQAEQARFAAAVRPLQERFVGSPEQRRLIARIRALR